MYSSVPNRRLLGLRHVWPRGAVVGRARLVLDGLTGVGKRLDQKGAGPLVSGKERLDGGPEFRTSRARLLQESGTLLGGTGQRFLEQGVLGHDSLRERFTVG
jgi:hypothetical protein